MDKIEAHQYYLFSLEDWELVPDMKCPNGECPSSGNIRKRFWEGKWHYLCLNCCGSPAVSHEDESVVIAKCKELGFGVE